MRMVDPYSPAEIRFRRRFVIVTAGLAVLAAAVFLSFPQIDISVSKALRVCTGVYDAPWCSQNPIVEFFRDIFIGMTVVAGIGIFVGLVRTLIAHRKWLGLAQARWWFLFVALGVGPGLVANIVIKDNWGRARPRTVVEFGGSKQFTPPLVFSKECHRNCSFVSGEVSSAVVPFFTAALVLPQVRVALLAGGIVTGLAVGTIRISQGGHFLSDVLFAGIFMALTASALHLLFIGLWQRRGLDEVLEPYLRPIREVLAPHLRPLQNALAPYVRAVRDASMPYVRRLQAVQTKLVWPRVVNLISALNQARS